MYPICYWQVSGRYFQPEPAMYLRCFHWFPGPLAPSERVSTFTARICDQWDIQVCQEQMVQDQQLQLLRELEDEDEATKGKDQKRQENPPSLSIAGSPTAISPTKIGAPHLSEAVTCLSEVDRNALSVTLVTLEVIGGFTDEEDEE